MVIFKSQEEIDKIRKAARLLLELWEFLNQHVQAGITTRELDADCGKRNPKSRSRCRHLKAIVAFLRLFVFRSMKKLFMGFLRDRKLKDGDIVSLDLGCIWEGFYGDAARTFASGRAVAMM